MNRRNNNFDRRRDYPLEVKINKNSIQNVVHFTKKKNYKTRQKNTLIDIIKMKIKLNEFLSLS